MAWCCSCSNQNTVRLFTSWRGADVLKNLLAGTLVLPSVFPYYFGTSDIFCQFKGQIEAGCCQAMSSAWISLQRFAFKAKMTSLQSVVEEWNELLQEYESIQVFIWVLYGFLQHKVEKFRHVMVHETSLSADSEIYTSIYLLMMNCCCWISTW